MSGDDRQAEHARLFGITARQVMRAAVQFAESTRETFSVMDNARLFLGAAVALALMETDRAGAAALLRDLANRIEGGADPAKLN